MKPSIRSGILAAASAPSPVAIGRAVCEALTTPADALARVWLVAPGGDLRLLASAGHPTGGGAYSRVDGEFGQIAFGVGKIGRIAATGESLVVPAVRGDEAWLANASWASRQAVRGFVACPLPSAAGAPAVGVLAWFTRTPLSDGDIEDVRFLAEFTAIRLREVSKPTDVQLLSRPDLRRLEKQAIEAALARSNGKIFGADGAAACLQMKPTTLASRIKVLGIR